MQTSCEKLVQKYAKKSVKNLWVKNVDKYSAFSFAQVLVGFSHKYSSFSQQFYTWFLKVFHLKKRSLCTFYTQLTITTKYIKEGKEKDES